MRWTRSCHICRHEPDQSRSASPAPLNGLIFVLILALALLLASVPPSRAADTVSGRVLVLHSYYPGFTWSDEEMVAIMATFRRAEPTADPAVEYMDRKRFGGEEYERQLLSIYRRKYTGAGLRVVLTTDNAAFDFALKYRDELFPRAAIVFCGLNGFSDALIAGKREVTGIVEEIDFSRTLDIALRLHPDRTKVAVIADTTETGLAIAESIRRVASSYRGHAEITILQGQSMTELLHAVGRLPADSIILLGAFNRDREGRTFSYEEVLALIRSRSPAPVYGFWSFLVGKGIVGGSLLSGSQQGQAAAEMTLRILGGEPVAALPVVRRAPTVLAFDYREMARFGIKPALLPPGSEVLNFPETFWSRYRQQVVLISVALLILTVIIGLLVLVLRQRAVLERQLRRSERMYRELVQGVNGIILRMDRDGRVIFANEYALKFFGYAEEELVGRGVVGTIVPETETTGRDLLAMVADIWENPGRYALNVNENILRSGERVWISWSNRPVFDEGGVLKEILAVGTDITPLKRSEEEIRRLNAELEDRVRERTAQLEASNRELEAFCYSVSHDLRAPLRHINSFGAIIMEDYGERLDGEAKESLLRICAASERMGELIDDLLELSRVSRTEMNCERVDISALAREIADEFRDAERDRAAEFVIAEGMGAWGDRRLLRLVLENLVGNAWKYTSREEKAFIEIGLGENGGGRQVYFVRDNGVGFDMKYADKLYGAFQRLHSPAEFEGSGIGLATVQRIVHRHGGDVWAEGETGKGATFFFSLPLAGAVPGL